MFLSRTEFNRLKNGNHYFAEASDLRLPVGRFPAYFWTDIADGQTLKLVKVTDDAAYYEPDNGPVRVTIFND